MFFCDSGEGSADMNEFIAATPASSDNDNNEDDVVVAVNLVIRTYMR